MSSNNTFPKGTLVHIFVFPYPAQGHMLSLLDLTHQLALRGLKITILVTPKNLPAINTLLLAHPNSIKPLVLPFPTHPNLPLEIENVKDIGNVGNAPIIFSLSKLEGEVIKWFKSQTSPPQAILSDFFLGFTNSWAKHLKIPRFAFLSIRAFTSYALDYLLHNLEALWDLQCVSFAKLPGSPAFVKDHLPSIYRRYMKGDPSWDVVKDSLLQNFKSWGLVFNSFYALESDDLDFVKKEVGHNRVYGVGPLSPLGLGQAGSGHSTRVLDWLDNCPYESVVYVCFGSQKMLTRHQIEALALGLERCKTRFVWVTKSESRELVPCGFEERVADRGLVVYGWASQVEILNHKAVGGFVSHCGWNSLLESITAGVLILAWPMEADQFFNASLFVEYLGSAVRLCEGEDTVPDPNMLGQVISEAFGKDIPQRATTKLIKCKAFEALKVGGSSMSDINELVQELRKTNTSN